VPRVAAGGVRGREDEAVPGQYLLVLGGALLVASFFLWLRPKVAAKRAAPARRGWWRSARRWAFSPG